jgi:CubicO group peptidase (beta-lactamase class C family)
MVKIDGQTSSGSPIYALVNIELGVPMSNGSVFSRTSITKVLTATAYLVVQEGTVRLDDKVTQPTGNVAGCF